MKDILQIPDSFWGLFQSKNRMIYMESLFIIYEEYLYNDYFLTRETCMQLLGDHFHNEKIELIEEENQNEKESTASIVFRKLVSFGWLRKVEDYANAKTNIVIPDYASLFIEAAKKIDEPENNITDLYIQNVYTNIYSFYHDKKAGIELLTTAMVNTSNLNRALQDLLHNMDRFFESLLKQESYETLLEEHLIGYVESIVDRKYSLLKTSDNFYIYKNDIKQLLRNIAEDEERILLLKRKLMTEGFTEEEAMEQFENVIDKVERGISNMERRIAHIDAEHTKYVRATVRRLDYLLNHDETMCGNVIQLLNLMGGSKKKQVLQEVANVIQIHDQTVFSEGLFYKKRGKRRTFEENRMATETAVELTREEILKLNQKEARFTTTEIEQFIWDRYDGFYFDVKNHPIETEEQFQLLILAYDYSLRKKSSFVAEIEDDKLLETGQFRYPNLVFKKR